MQDKRNGAEEGAAGWAHCVGLTRNIRLSDDGTDVCVEPDPRLYSLLGEELLHLENTGAEEANAALEEISGDMLYIHAVLRPEENCTQFGLTVKTNGKRDETTFTYDPAERTINGYTSNKGSEGSSIPVNGFLPLKDGKLEMEVFADRSLVEGFFNADKSVSIRAYPKKKSQGIRLFTEGGLAVELLEVRRVDSIY